MYEHVYRDTIYVYEHVYRNFHKHETANCIAVVVESDFFSSYMCEKCKQLDYLFQFCECVLCYALALAHC